MASMLRLSGAACVALALLLHAGQALTAAPRLINYQGYLTDASEVPVNGPAQIVVQIYTTQSGGASVWSETHAAQVHRGVYSLVLGSITPLALLFNAPYFVGVTIDAGTELTPRQPLTSVPYALNAVAVHDGSIYRASLAAPGGNTGDVLSVSGGGLAWSPPPTLACTRKSGQTISVAHLETKNDTVTCDAGYVVTGGGFGTMGPYSTTVTNVQRNTTSVICGITAGGASGSGSVFSCEAVCCKLQ